MFYIIDTHGTTKAVITEPIYQGSVGVNDIVLFAPFPANAQITVSAYLPNGIPIKNLKPLSATVYPQGMPELKDGSGNNYTAFSGVIDKSLTAYAGAVQIQFSVFLGTGKKLNTYTTSFVVNEGVVTEPLTIPSDQDYYDAILELLAQINSDPLKSVVYNDPESLILPSDVSFSGTTGKDQTNSSPNATIEYIGSDDYFFVLFPLEFTRTLTLDFDGEKNIQMIQFWMESPTEEKQTISIVGKNGEITRIEKTIEILPTVGKVSINPRVYLDSLELDKIEISFLPSENLIACRGLQIFKQNVDGEYIFTFNSGATAIINAPDGATIEQYMYQSREYSLQAKDFRDESETIKDSVGSMAADAFDSANAASSAATEAQNAKTEAQNAKNEALAYADQASSAATEAQNALNIILNKKVVYYEPDLRSALDAISYNTELQAGDLIIIGEKGVPDLSIFADSGQALSGAETITQQDIQNNNLPQIEPGSKFKVQGNGLGFVALESGADLTNYVTKSEFNNAITTLQTAINSKQNQLTFDSAPTPDSLNPVTSGGIYNALHVSGGGTVTPKQYAEISTITLNENQEFVEFSNLNLTDFYVEIQGGFVDGSSSGIYVILNDATYVLVNARVALNTTTERGCIYRFYKQNDGFLISACSTSNGGLPYNAQANIAMQVMIPPNYQTGLLPVNKIKLFTATGTTKQWISGSTFKLWGIENDNG